MKVRIIKGNKLISFKRGVWHIVDETRGCRYSFTGSLRECRGAISLGEKIYKQMN